MVYGLDTKENESMATLEERIQALEREHERLQTLEQEHTQLKKTIELQTIAIRALVSKESFEKLQDTVGRIETAQESLKLDFERQEKRINRFEKQTNDQLTAIKEDTTTLKEQLALVVTMLRRVLPPEEQR
jgi:DNA repair exonuclease SbcCD ATPase subunit